MSAQLAPEHVLTDEEYVVVASAEDLHVTFRRNGKAIHALRGISLEIRRGEILGLVGESGSGKSVLGLTLLGLHGAGATISGRAEVRGRDMVSATDAQRREVRIAHLGAVFQDPMTSLNPTMRVGRQVAEAAGSNEEALRLLRLVGVPEAESRMSAYPHELSGGLRQRVMIAMAVAGNPDLVIADEPTTALDVTVQAQVLRLLRTLRDELGCSVLMITHDLGVAAQIADRVAVMYAGRLAEIGESDEVLRNSSHPYTLGLMRSRLTLGVDRARALPSLPGEVPSPVEPLSGCAFSPRCSFAGADCDETLPEPLEVQPGHKSACVRPLAIVRATGAVGLPELMALEEPVPVDADVLALSLRAVVKTFPAGSGFGRKRSRKLHALRGVSLRISQGESVALVGESGSGKSTLLRIAAGLETADSGEVDLSAGSRPQMVFQDSGASLTPWMTVEQLLGERVRDLGRAARAAKVREALSLVGLPAEVGAARAHQEMLAEGFHPDFPPAVLQQVKALQAQSAVANGPPVNGQIRDLRSLLWSSIDNDTSRDLDQAEVAERVNGGIRVMIAVADVDSDVSMGSPADQHAAGETTSVYTGVRTFPMLPEALSTGLTSLNEGVDRVAIVIDMLMAADGAVSSQGIYRAVVRNQAQLAYNGVGAWLEGGAPPPKVAASADLAAQLKLQDEAAQTLLAARRKLGALAIDREETEAVVADGQVQGIETRLKNRASDLIENFMVAANGVMARTLSAAGVSSIRRVVKTPERWPRIVELAANCGETLPADPDSGALSAFLQKRKAVDPVHYADLSLAVIKLMGPGEYVLQRPGDASQGHFALAAHDYTHSTAPNRRFADTVAQRLIKSVIAKAQPPYSDSELNAIATNCTLKEDAARKVERAMNKRIAAVVLLPRIGEMFSAVVTGVTPKGTFVRVLNPHAEGLLIRGQQGVDVGDQLQVKLVSADPRRGYIDFAR